MLEKNLVGHHALVTGASSGIGTEIAKDLARRGANVTLVARRKERLERLVQEIMGANPEVQAFAFPADLNSDIDRKKIIEEAGKTSPITILVNNAGSGKYGQFMDFSVEDHRMTVELNSVAPMELCYGFIKKMRGLERQCYILNVASMAAFQPVGNFSVYCGTKSFLRDFSEIIHFELSGTNVSVTCSCPGGTETEFFEHSGQLITRSGKKTLMSAQDVAIGSINAMCSGQSVFIPGFINKLGCFLPRFLPRKPALSIAVKVMNRAVQRGSV